MSSVTRLDCPDCGAALRIAQVLRPGQLIKCPKCAVTFAAPSAPAVVAAPATRPSDATDDLNSAAGPSRRRAPEEDEPTIEHTPDPGENGRTGRSRTTRRDDWDDDDRPARKTGRKKAKQGRGAMWLLGGAVVLGLLLVAGAVWTAWHFLSPLVGSNKEKEFAINTSVQPAPHSVPPQQSRPPGGGGAGEGEGAVPPQTKQDVAAKVRHELTLPPAAVSNPVVGFGKGNLAPEITGDDLDGRAMKLSDFRGKVVLLDFWGDWCPHCRAMYGHEKQLAQRLKGKPFALVGINSDSSQAVAKRVVRDQQLPGQSWYDGEQGGTIGEQYGVHAWPTFMILDAKGRIRYKLIGRPPEAEAMIDQIIDALLEEANKEKSASG